MVNLVVYVKCWGKGTIVGVWGITSQFFFWKLKKFYCKICTSIYHVQVSREWCSNYCLTFKKELVKKAFKKRNDI